MDMNGGCDGPAGAWRASAPVLRVGRVAVGIGLLAAVLCLLWLLLAPRGDRLAVALVATAGLILSAATWRAALYPRVLFTEQALVIHNPLGSTRVAWAEVASVTPGYSGLVVSRTNAPPVTAWAVQESNLRMWLGRQGRAQRIAEQIEQLARSRGGGESMAAAREARVRVTELEPLDAVREPLPGLWRMTRPEAALVGFVRYSTSPLGALLTACFWGAIALTGLTLIGWEQWDSYRLETRGDLVAAEVLGIPGTVEVTWEGIEPQIVRLEANDAVAEKLRVGEHVDVIYDADEPTRARLAGVKRDGEVTYIPVALALIGSVTTTGSLKWWRWLTVAEQPPRGSSGARHRK